MDKCHSLGPEWSLPGKTDMDFVTEAASRRGWGSVWTSIKMVKFGRIFWEDGSEFVETNGELKA